MKPTLILMVGCVASGKTRFSKDYVSLNPSVVRLSTDEFRAIVGNGEGDQTVSGKVFQTVYAVTEHLLKQGKSVLIDACNYHLKARKDFLDIAKRCDAETAAYVFRVPLDVLKLRNKGRVRQVPEDVIEKQFNNFVIPTVGEFGFVCNVE